MLTSKEIRESFKNFFAEKGHKIVPSAPMVLKDDPTLMFTNAGMNQFKDEGTGKLQNEYNSKIKTVMDRFKAITKDADDYKSFSGIADGMDGSVKFIFQTAEIKSDDK